MAIVGVGRRYGRRPLRYWLVSFLAAAMAMSACGDGGDASSSPDSPSTEGAEGAAATEQGGTGGSDGASDTVVLIGYGGTSQETMEAHILPLFTEETGIEVVYTPATAAQMYSQVRASAQNPDMDVAWTNPVTHLGGKEQDLYAELDPEIVTNLENVFDWAIDPDNIGVTMGVNPMGIEYNTEVFEENGWDPPSSWRDFWAPEYEGHVGFYTIDIAFSQFWLAGYQQSIGAETLDPVWEDLEELEPKLASVVTSTAEMDQLFASGTAWIALNSNARSFQTRDNGAPVDWVPPDEGAVLFTNYFDVVKGAPHPEAAQRFINFMLEPEVQEIMAQELYYGPVVEGLDLSEDVQREAFYSPTGDLNAVSVDVARIEEELPEWTRQWKSILGG